MIIGQNIMTGLKQYLMARWLLEGDVRAIFNSAAQQHGNQTTIANFQMCLNDVTSHVFPSQALALQKQYMRHYMRNPCNLSTREYMAHVNELNEFLKEFPGFVEGQELQHDEVMDIAEYGVPATWQRAMVVHGFDPLDHTVPEFIEFCE